MNKICLRFGHYRFYTSVSNDAGHLYTTEDAMLFEDFARLLFAYMALPIPFDLSGLAKDFAHLLSVECRNAIYIDFSQAVFFKISMQDELEVGVLEFEITNHFLQTL